MSGLTARIAFLLLLLLQSAPVFAQENAPAPAAAAVKEIANPPNAAGAIDLMEGDVRVFDANRVRCEGIKLKDTVNEGDSVVTGPDGELHLNMQDGGYLAVRPNTAMKIRQYRANGDADDISVIGVLKGALRSVTGFIGQFNPHRTRIVTPTATIGIRGTDHETQVIEPNSSAGDAGTYDKVNTGGTFIQTPQGRVDVTPNHAGFAAHGGKVAPRVLDHVPGFFKPTRNEHLIEGRHAQMQPKLQQLREQRRQQVQQRQGAKAAAEVSSKAGKGGEPAAKAAAQEQRKAERQQTKADAQQKRKQAAAEQQQKRQAARQQAIAPQQERRQKIEAQKKVQQQEHKAPAKKEKE